MQPELSVVLPISDSRGSFTDHMSSWLKQTLSCERYQIVIASDGGDPGLEDEIRSFLRPQDRIVRAPDGYVTSQYNAAAAAADAPWLVLTEAHCIADPSCLENVMRVLNSGPEFEAATLNHTHAEAGALQEAGARFFENVYEEWRTQDWRQIKLLGTVIRRDVYERIGGLQRRAGLFSVPLFSARLDESGVRVGHIGSATVKHVFEDTPRDHHEKSMDYTLGECDTRALYDTAFCERYFGHSALWANRGRLEAATARSVSKSLASAMRTCVLKRPGELPWLARELGSWLSARFAGLEPGLSQSRASFLGFEFATGRLPMPAWARWICFQRAQNAAVRLSRLRWIRDHLSDTPANGLTPGVYPASELGPESLVGANGPEPYHERSFRWCGPVTVLRIASGARWQTVSIDTGGLRGDPLTWLTGVFANGRAIPKHALHSNGGRLVVQLPALTEQAERTDLTILARRLARTGTRERRRLALPVFSVEIKAGV